MIIVIRYQRWYALIGMYLKGISVKRISIHTTEFRALSPLIGVLAVTALIATWIGVFRNDFYKDGEWINAQWQGQDLVTLIVAIPLLVIASKKAIFNRSLVWELVLAGVLFYFVYVYTFYVFEASFTFLYFFHLPVFSIALLCLFLVCHHILNARNDYAYTHNLSKFTISFFLLAVSTLLSWLWLEDLINHLTFEKFLSPTPDGEPPLIIYTLDLGIMIPLMVIAVFLFIKNYSLGLILIGVMLIVSFLLGFALMAMSTSMYLQNLDPDPMLIVIWSMIGLAGLLLSIVYLNRLEVYPTVVGKNTAS